MIDTPCLATCGKINGRHTPKCLLFKMELKNQMLRSYPLIAVEPSLYTGRTIRVIPAYKFWKNPFKWFQDRKMGRFLEKYINSGFK